jgi:hypothetical protein
MAIRKNKFKNLNKSTNNNILTLPNRRQRMTVTLERDPLLWRHLPTRCIFRTTLPGVSQVEIRVGCLVPHTLRVALQTPNGGT